MDNSDKASELCAAAATGDLKKVTNLVNEGVDVNSHIVGGITALMKASTNGHLEVVKLLVEKGANVNQTDRFGYNALLWAIDNRIANLNTIKYLVEHKSDINVKAKDTEYTPLHLAAENGDLDKLKYLAEHGARIDEKTKKGERPVHLAAAAGHVDVLEYFLTKQNVKFDIFEAAEKGYTSAVKYFIGQKKKAPTSVDKSGWSVLHRAAHGGSLETVKYLVEVKKVPVNFNNWRLVTALHEASDMGHTAVAAYLLEQGADVNAKGPVGRTPLYWAANNGHLDIVKLFIEVGKANAYQTDNDGNTLLHAAEWKGSLNVVKYLVEEMGLDVNARDNSGNTPLLETVRNGKLNVFYYLLEERNADVELADNDDVTCLHVAANKQWFDVCKALVNHGANVNAKNRDGRTPLYIACDGTENMVASLDLVRYFIEEKKADPLQRDNYGNTLLHAAEWHGSLDVVKYLVEKQGLDVNAKDNDGNTPLAETIQRGKVVVTKYLQSKNAHTRRRRRRSAPSSDVRLIPVNSAFRHYSVINHVSNYALNIAAGYLTSSSEPFLKASSAMSAISNFDLLGGFLMLLNVGCRKLFCKGIKLYSSSESDSLLSPPQLVALHIDPNATAALKDSFRYETEF